MTDNFADHPRSVTEIKSDRTRRANDWTPRDVLIELLRKIDGGELPNLDALVVCYRDKPENGAVKSYYSASSPDIHVSLGLIERIKHNMQEIG